MAVGFTIARGHNWSHGCIEDSGGFPHDGLQEYLLPYFTVEGEEVDPYDGASFFGHQLDLLVAQLERALAEVALHPPNWPFTTPAQVASFHESCRVYQIEHLAPRDHALKTLNRAIELACRARQRNERLEFIGD
jgi:hypothetical protein